MRPIAFVIPFAILAAYIGQGLDSDTAALAMGGIIGLMAAAILLLIYAIARDNRAARDRQQAQRTQSPAPSPQPPAYIEGAWRELPPTPQATAPRPQPAIEAPTRAVTIRR